MRHRSDAVCLGAGPEAADRVYTVTVGVSHDQPPDRINSADITDATAAMLKSSAHASPSRAAAAAKTLLRLHPIIVSEQLLVKKVRDVSTW